jgi:hypothetical protein
MKRSNLILKTEMHMAPNGIECPQALLINNSDIKLMSIAASCSRQPAQMNKLHPSFKIIKTASSFFQKPKMNWYK